MAKTEESRWRNRKKQIIRWESYKLVRDELPEVMAGIIQRAQRRVQWEKRKSRDKARA